MPKITNYQILANNKIIEKMSDINSSIGSIQPSQPIIIPSKDAVSNVQLMPRSIPLLIPETKPATKPKIKPEIKPENITSSHTLNNLNTVLLILGLCGVIYYIDILTIS